MIKLMLPVAPNLNHRYVNRMFVLSTPWRKFKEDVAEICKTQKVKPLKGDLYMNIQWYRAKKQGDVDGKIKAVMDALQGFAYENDKQVGCLEISRHEDKENPRMEVRIAKWL